MLPTARPMTFLIADISGYTRYLGGVELDHAQDILADLMGSIVKALEPAFTLAKMEGDAAFACSEGDSIDGSMLLDTIERCYFGFRRRRRDVEQATSCSCDACSRIPDLDLKFIVHHGQAIDQVIAGTTELLGSDVIITHRLLKNGVVDTLNVGAYVLITDACVARTDLIPSDLGFAEHYETYESVGDVKVWVLDLERRWAEEDKRARVIVTPDESILSVDIPVAAPPQTAWDFLTRPGQRMSWQPWVTSVEVKGATGGRRGPGSANHCMHGENAVIEEILDWRPYDYVTDRTIVETPSEPVSFLHTIEFEPTATGTIIHYRFSPPDDEADRAMADSIAHHYGDALRAAVPALVDQIEAAAAESTSG